MITEKQWKAIGILWRTIRIFALSFLCSSYKALIFELWFTIIVLYEVILLVDYILKICEHGLGNIYVDVVAKVPFIFGRNLVFNGILLCRAYLANVVKDRFLFLHKWVIIKNLSLNITWPINLYRVLFHFVPF